MNQYPMHFQVSGFAEAGMEKTWKATSAENRESTQAIPPEFGGPGGGFSPEDLFALALLNCFIATFKVFAQNSKIQYKSIETKGSLTVDKGEHGQPWMKYFLLEASINGAADIERTRRLAEKASKSCLVHHSVKTQIEYKFNIN